MFRLSHFVAAILIVFCLRVSPSFAQDLRDQVINGWKRLEKENQTVSFSSSAFAEGKGQGITKYVCQGEYSKVETDSTVYLKSDTGIHVLYRNSQRVWQQVSSKDVNWPDLSSNCNRAFCVSNTNLLKALEDSKFEFSDWRKTEDQIEFVVKDLKELEQRKKKEPHRPASFATIRVSVDTRNNCRILTAEENGEWKELKAHIHWQYSYDEDPFLPSSILRTSLVSNGKKLLHMTMAESISHKPLPESEFGLGSYGLKE